MSTYTVARPSNPNAKPSGRSNTPSSESEALYESLLPKKAGKWFKRSVTPTEIENKVGLPQGQNDPSQAIEEDGPEPRNIMAIMNFRQLCQLVDQPYSSFRRSIELGLPVKVMLDAKVLLDFSDDEMMFLLGMTRSTFMRRKKTPETFLSHNESDRLYLLAKVVTEGLKLFDDCYKSLSQWLKTPAFDLNYEASPLEIMDSTKGCDEVIDIINRIGDGVY